jgi:hypothetical protein
MAAPEKPRQVILTLRCVVTKVVACEGCTPEEAIEAPWEYAVDENEVEQADWLVVKAEVDDGTTLTPYEVE